MRHSPDPSKAPGSRSGTPPDIHRHVARMTPSYAERFSDEEIVHHAELASQLDEDHLAEVGAVPREDGSWQVTIVAFDFPGELSLIWGLMFAYDLDIPVATCLPTSRRTDFPAGSRERTVGVRSWTSSPCARSSPRAWGWTCGHATGPTLAAYLSRLHSGQRRGRGSWPDGSRRV